MVVIISSDEDEHLPLVISHLQGEYTVLDAGSMVEGHEVSFIFNRGRLRVQYEGRDITKVKGVWLRRPRSIGIEYEVPVPARYKDYSRDALCRQLAQLYTTWQGATWISNRYAIMQAENKSYQLLVAYRVGFRVPDTTITSSAQEAEKLIQAHPASVAKSLSCIFPNGKTAGHFEVFYAAKIKPSDESNFSGLQVAPTIFQQAIEHRTDIRVTVVGDAVFAARIAFDEVAGERIRDWHIAYERSGLRIEACGLTLKIRRQCIALVKELGLAFGAIDFVQDRQGRLWFIEINPNGQWGFIEEQTGQPIGKTIAALLEGSR